MKVIACYPLHYGKDYLAWSIRCLQDVVDEIHIFYTSLPSFGHSSGQPCPDSRDELLAEANRFAKKPINWYEIHAGNEGQHRDHFLRLAEQRGADIMLPVDSDEVWDPIGLEVSLKHIFDTKVASRYLCRFANFWQSWKWQVHDQFRPVRAVDMRVPFDGSSDYFDELTQPSPIYHFGYAQREVIMRYKWTCHGHQSEMRPGWVEQKYMNWTPDTMDLHPTVNNLWDRAHPTEQSVWTKINELMTDHPYRELEIIR